MVGVMPLVGPIPGGPELLIILLVLVLLFGAQKIPKLARSTGKALGEFRKGREEINDELENMQTDTTPEAASPPPAETTETPEAATETESTS